MIYFEKVRFKNFGSFGNSFTELELTKRPMTLVSGNNGHGKSFALLDSITFALFGKPFRKINIPQLINSINQKDCLVEVEFRVNDVAYKIVRGLKPKVFEIYKNGELINQHAKSKDYQRMLEEQILRMNYKSFTQVVILGSSSFVPFMQLPAADRRTIIEDILDINIFSTMNTLLKEKISSMREEIKDNERRAELVTEKIRMQEKHIDSLREQSQKSIEEFDSKIESSIADRKKIEAEVKKFSTEVSEMLSTIKDKDLIKKNIQQLEKLMTQVTSKRERYENQLNEISNKSSCSECGQALPENHIESLKQATQDKLEKMVSGLVEMNDNMRALMERNQEIQAVSEIVQEKQSTLNELNGRLNASNSHIQQLESMKKQASSETTSIDEQIAILENHKSEMEKVKEERKTLIELQNNHAVAHTLLKDSGIKSKIIKHYLPIMNKLINHYLTSMDFFAQFHLDEEFNETIKSRHRDTFSYMSFSEGEKLRIDLSLLLAWREIARLKNSANCNLLILDEVFDSSLDGLGTEEFMKLLHSLGKKCNIFVISHKSDHLTDKFPGTLGFEKKGNFSRIIK